MERARSLLAIIGTKVNPAWAVRLLALLLALAHVLLEGIASADGALLAEGVVLGRHGGGVVGVGLGRATPGSVVGDVTGVLGRGVGHLEGGEAALKKVGRIREGCQKWCQKCNEDFAERRVYRVGSAFCPKDIQLIAFVASCMLPRLC
jgi:hypothetical protein